LLVARFANADGGGCLDLRRGAQARNSDATEAHHVSVTPGEPMRRSAYAMDAACVLFALPCMPRRPRRSDHSSLAVLCIDWKAEHAATVLKLCQLIHRSQVAQVCCCGPTQTRSHSVIAAQAFMRRPSRSQTASRRIGWLKSAGACLPSTLVALWCGKHGNDELHTPMHQITQFIAPIALRGVKMHAQSPIDGH